MSLQCGQVRPDLMRGGLQKARKKIHDHHPKQAAVQDYHPSEHLLAVQKPHPSDNR